MGTTQSPQNREIRERSPMAPILHSAGQRKPNLMPSLEEPRVPQSFPETAACMGRPELITTSSMEAEGQTHVSAQPSLCSTGAFAASISLGSSLSSSAVQEPSLSSLACQAGTSPGCSPPGFMALISRQPDLDTAGSGSPVPMESATQEAAKPFLCARRKGALLACPGGQRESRASGPWESERTNGAQQQKKP